MCGVRAAGEGAAAAEVDAIGCLDEDERGTGFPGIVADTMMLSAPSAKSNPGGCRDPTGPAESREGGVGVEKRGESPGSRAPA